jgi:hypothetical protein
MDGDGLSGDRAQNGEGHWGPTSAVAHLEQIEAFAPALNASEREFLVERLTEAAAKILTGERWEKPPEPGLDL